MVVCAHCLKPIKDITPDIQNLYNFGCKDKCFNSRREFIRSLGVDWDLCMSCNIDLFNKSRYNNARRKLQIMKDLFYEKLLQVKEENKKFACYFCDRHCHGFGSEGLHHACDYPDKFRFNSYHIDEAFNVLTRCNDYRVTERLRDIVHEYKILTGSSLAGSKVYNEVYHFFETDKCKKTDLNKFMQSLMTKYKWYKI